MSVNTNVSFIETSGFHEGAPASFVRIDDREFTQFDTIQKLVRDLTSEQLEELGLGQTLLEYQTDDSGSDINAIVRHTEISRAARRNRALGLLIGAYNPETGEPAVTVGMGSFAYPGMQRPSVRKPKITEWRDYFVESARERFSPETNAQRIGDAWIVARRVEQAGLDPSSFVQNVFRGMVQASDESRIPTLLVGGRGYYEKEVDGVIVVEHAIDDELLDEQGFERIAQHGATIEGVVYNGEIWQRANPNTQQC
jgi:hypothetical protein